MAIQAAIKTANVLRDEEVKLVHIRTTLKLDEIRVSESLLPRLIKRPDVEILRDPEEWLFDADGSLSFTACWSHDPVYYRQV